MTDEENYIILNGSIQKIIFRNEINGYTVATFIPTKNDLKKYSKVEQIISYKQEISIVGVLPNINEGDVITITSRLIYHHSYGEQLEVITFQKPLPKTLDSFQRYLGSGDIKGVGPSIAKKIVDNFGDESISILKSNPEKLASIKGLTLEKARIISESFNQNWVIWEIVDFLKKFEIGAESAKSIYNALGNDAISKIEENPYLLINVGIKINFEKIDKIAKDIGIPHNSLERIGSGIIHIIKKITQEGSTCAKLKMVLNQSSILLEIPEDELMDGIKDIVSKEKVFLETRILKNDDEIKSKNDILTKKAFLIDDKVCINKFDKIENEIEGKTNNTETWIYLKNFYLTELNIAKRIKLLKKSPNIKGFIDINKEIKEHSSIKLSEKQNEAINLINENNVSIITGGPGTGKTTIIKTIIDIYDFYKKKCVLAAPTGRAAKRMTEATGKDASTLHRLLEIRKIEDDEPDPFLEVKPIDADIIIIDEVSMVDMFLMNYILGAIYAGTKLILVGDSDQLPSVGPGNVLKDLLLTNDVPYIVLNKIFRQAAKSQIIVNSHKVNEGINFLNESKEKNTLNDFTFINEDIPEFALDIVMEKYDTDTQIITPSKKGTLGTKNLNKLIQERYNPKSFSKHERKYIDIIFREGDKVMQIRNNYDIEWNNGEKLGFGIFNGEMGYIGEITDDGLTICFDDGKNVLYGFEELDQIDLCYAITVHKSQGSEFDKVLIPIYDSSPLLLTRNLLYTGMTRAKQYLTIIGSHHILDFMIKNVNIKKRNTGLQIKFQMK